jgi:hypothetical protein
MKNSVPWILFFAGMVILTFGTYYFFNSFFPFHSVASSGSHHFGPRTFLWGFFLCLLTVFAVGFILYNLFFPSSGSAKEEEDFCPFCGREFQRSESLSQEPPETIK